MNFQIYENISLKFFKSQSFQSFQMFQIKTFFINQAYSPLKQIQSSQNCFQKLVIPNFKEHPHFPLRNPIPLRNIVTVYCFNSPSFTTWLSNRHYPKTNLMGNNSNVPQMKSHEMTFDLMKACFTILPKRTIFQKRLKLYSELQVQNICRYSIF
jgi:hypothetical protein